MLIAYLENGEQRLVEGVEVVTRFFGRVAIIETTAKELHSEKREDDDEQKEQQQKTGDWTHTVEKWRNEIT